MLRRRAWAAAVILLALAPGLALAVPPEDPSHATEPAASRSAAAHPTKRTHRRHAAKKPEVRYPTVVLYQLNTHERFRLRPDAHGRLDAQRLRGLRHFLRCHHTGREHAIAPRLARLLYQTARHFGDHVITVIAGYRAPRVARAKGNPRSHHKQGLACDFRIDGIDDTALRDYLRATFKGVGVGYYPNAHFVHLDVGRPRGAYWVDYSHPGEPARYTEPDPDEESPPSDEELPALDGPAPASPVAPAEPAPPALPPPVEPN